MTLVLVLFAWFSQGLLWPWRDVDDKTGKETEWKVYQEYSVEPDDDDESPENIDDESVNGVDDDDEWHYQF